jgi:hypothetical protein
MHSESNLDYRAKILFVVQAGERNIFDQRWLEYELLEKQVEIIFYPLTTLKQYL